MTITGNLKQIETEILAAHVEHEGGDRRWNYNGKKNLTTKEFTNLLKEKHPSLLGNKKTVSITAAINTLARDHFGLTRASPSPTQPVLSDPISRSIKIPPGTTGIIVRTRDPKTEISFFISHVMEEL